MTERPFVHKKAFANVRSNFIFHEEVASILFRVIEKKGILNIGGKTQTIFNFARKYNPKIKKNKLVMKSRLIKKNISINTKKLKNIILN